MTDQLYLSLWLNRTGKANRVREFRKLLRLFPFSQRREQPQTTVSVLAISTAEPPLLERDMNGPVAMENVEQVLSEFQGDDVAYEVEGWWDVWQWDQDWELRPARVILSCFAEQFDAGSERGTHGQEDLRIDFGVDTYFLPDNNLAGSTKMSELNIRSLLRLVHEIDDALPVNERVLETESGENFADRLHQRL